MPENQNKFLSALLFVLYLVFLVSLIFSVRAINSISIPLLLIVGLAKNKIEKRNFLSAKLKSSHPFLLPVFSCCKRPLCYMQITFTRD